MATKETNWIIIATRHNEQGDLEERIYETFSTTFEDYEVIAHIVPAMLDDVLKDQRRFHPSQIKLYKMFQVPIGVEDVDDDGDELDESYHEF